MEKSEEGRQKKTKLEKSDGQLIVGGPWPGMMDDLLTVMQCSPVSQFLSMSNQLDRLDGEKELCDVKSMQAE